MGRIQLFSTEEYRVSKFILSNIGYVLKASVSVEIWKCWCSTLSEAGVSYETDLKNTTENSVLRLHGFRSTNFRNLAVYQQFQYYELYANF